MRTRWGGGGGGGALGPESGLAARRTHHAPRRSAPAAGSGPGRAPSRAASRATGRPRSASARGPLPPEQRGARPSGSDLGPAPGARPREPPPTAAPPRGPALARALPRVRRSAGSGEARAQRAQTCGDTRLSPGCRRGTRGWHAHTDTEVSLSGCKALESALSPTPCPCPQPGAEQGATKLGHP